VDGVRTYRTQFQLVDQFGGVRSMDVDLIFRVSDPLAVEIAITCGLQPVSWTVARSVLAAGLHTPAGIGDVRLRPTSCGAVAIEFDSPSGYALVRAYSEDLRRFLKLTYELVEIGAEQVDVDQLIDELINGGPQQ
jgi:hypothetical protein